MVRSAEEIRGEAIEVLAQAQFERDGGGDWALVPDATRNAERRRATYCVDALAAAGLLPTGEEWGAGGVCAPPCITGMTEQAARERDRLVWWRYEHEWQEAWEASE